MYYTPHIKIQVVWFVIPWFKEMKNKITPDYLTTENVDFKYEKKLYNSQNEYVIPDFYLPEHDIYIEFWGMVDVEDEEVAMKYKSHKKWKEGVYKRMDTKLIHLCA